MKNTYIKNNLNQQFPAVFNLSSLNGRNGFKIDGINSNDYSGQSLSAGDINGDGIKDVIIGALNALNNAGQSYVVFGSKNPFSDTILLKELNGANGFKIHGIDSDESGSALSTGDINGDGITDIIIGAPWALYAAGQSYVVFGSKDPFPSDISLDGLHGINGFKINGINPNSHSGEILSSGDINGDGICDLIISARYALNDAGQSYVVFGSRSPFLATIFLKDLNGINGFKIDGVSSADQSGWSLSSGDINGDSIVDVIIGAPGALHGAGQSYVIFGSHNPFPDTMSLDRLNGKNGFTIYGVSPRDNSGRSLSAGDINGDGIMDVIIGASDISNNAGRTYVVFGSKSAFPMEILLKKLNGINGFKIDGIRGNNLEVTSSAGDINGDGIMDVIIGNHNALYHAGQSYIVFGSRKPFDAEILLEDLNGRNGFKINGIEQYDQSGHSLSSGDINGDGVSDIIIGADFALNHTGQSYVVFGQNYTMLD